jgi:hypothetical protein
MPWSKTLNEQPAMARWTAEPKRNNDGNELANEEDGKRYHDQPRPVENEHGNDAREEKREPTARPNDEPRLSVKASGDRLLDRVH